MATDETFASLVWDSGFCAIDATGHGENTPALAYAGPVLELSGTYFWRAAVMDSEQISGAFSTPAWFTVCGPGTAADLRVTTGIGSEQRQGDPVCVMVWPPSLSAEYVGGEVNAAFVQFQVSHSADFQTVVWTSAHLPVGDLGPGMRTPSFVYGGGNSLGSSQLTHFWRARFSASGIPGSEGPWSTSKSSFLRTAPGNHPPAPGGFSRAAMHFGVGVHTLSRTVAGDVDGNGIPDVVGIAAATGGAHTLYLDPGIASPAAPILFGESSGGRTLALAHDFRLQGSCSIAIVDENFARLYVYSGGQMGLFCTFELGLGAPVALQVADTNRDGWPDILVAFDHAVYEIRGGVAGFTGLFNHTSFAFTDPITDLLSTVFEPSSGIRETWVLSGGNLLLFRGLPVPQSWDATGATKLSRANGANPYLAQLVLAGPSSLAHATVQAEKKVASVTFGASAEHGMKEPVTDISGRDLTGDGALDIVLAAGSTVSVWRAVGGTYVLHEHTGHPGGQGVTNVVVSDMNGDLHADILVGTAEPAHSIFLNKSRLTVSIADTYATQQEFGQVFAAFQVTLSSAPVSMVQVWCESVQEESGGGEGDGDGLPDASTFVVGQTSTTGYVPTATRIVFAPGQTVAWFRVPLTSVAVGLTWTFQVRLFAPVGAATGQAMALATVYGTVPAASPGAPPVAPGMTRDWSIDGEVRAIATSGQNTYFGGQFGGIQWQAQGVASLTLECSRKAALPQVSGSIEAVAVDPANGDIYFGGNFTLHVGPGLTIKNIAKCLPDGSLATGFAPNPNGTVNAIATDAYNRVYFGGKFTELQAAPGQTFHNIAWVSSSGQVSAATWGGANCYGVSNTSTTHAEVLVLKVSDSGGSGSYLLAGGQYFNQARSNSNTFSVANFAGFSLSGQAPLTMPRINSGSVRAIEVDSYGTLIGYTGSLSFAIFLGGTFDHATWQIGSTTAYSLKNLAVTNFSGFYSQTLTAAATSATPVLALARDGSNRLWIGRNGGASGGQPDPISIFLVTGGLLTPHSTIVGDGPVFSLAPGNGRMLATGSFATVAGQAAPGAALLTAGTSPGNPLSMVARPHGGSIKAAVYSDAGNNGYVLGGTFTSLRASRGNLAAMNAQGQLLAWAPRANGPIHAMAANAGKIYFGGAFTDVSGQARTGLAAAPANNDAVSPDGWHVTISGGSASVNALAIRPASPHNLLIVGGDFASVNMVSRIDVAEVNPAIQGAPPTSWNPGLAQGATDAVHALLVDSDRIYIGGCFAGTTLVQRPGLLAVIASGLPNEGQPVNWDAQLVYPATIRGIAATGQAIVFVGDFSGAAGEPRVGAACLDKISAAATPFQPVPTGSFRQVQTSTGGLIYLAGDFTTISVSQSQGTAAYPRRGLAAFDAAGNILPWTANVLTPGTSETVQILLLDDGKLWAGGRFSGTPHPGNNDLTWFSAAWYITTPTLPDVGSGLAYPSFAMHLSEPPVTGVTWSVSGPAAAWLTIDPSLGLLGGTAPAVSYQSPPLFHPLTVTVTDGTRFTSRQFIVRVNPAPAPITAEFPAAPGNPVTIAEGNAPARVVHWDVKLVLPPGQAVSVPLHFQVEHINGTARWGYEYAGQVNRVIFFPQGQVPGTLPAGTIATDTHIIALPVTIYGDKVAGHLAMRDFRLKVTSLTQGAQGHPTADELHIQIMEDDPANPAPDPAYVLYAAVQEDAHTPADPRGVVADQPFIAWVFGSDVAGESQGAWQVQVATDSGFLGLVYSAAKTAGTQNQTQVGPLPGGEFFTRVRVWDLSTDTPGPWCTFAFRRNFAPLQASQLAPAPEDTYTPPGGGLTVNTARPMLTWTIADDLDGDRQHVIVKLTSASGGVVRILDSRVAPNQFEYWQGSGWAMVGQSGMLPGAAQMRARVPDSMELFDGDWHWQVNVADPYEVTVGTTVSTLTVSAAYVIRGVYAGATGPDPRRLRLVKLPGHAPLATPALTNPLNGEFEFVVGSGALAGGEIIAVCVDPSYNPNGTGPVDEYAAVVLRYPGSHLRDNDGQFRKLELVQGRFLLDSRGASGFNLGHLTPPASPVPGYPMEGSPTGLRVVAQFDSIQTMAELRVRGTYAASAEPNTLVLAEPHQWLSTLADGFLSIEEGGTAQLRQLDNRGSVVIHPTGVLELNSNSESSGSFHLGHGGMLNVGSARLTITHGQAVLLAGNVVGTAANACLRQQAGSLHVHGATLDGVILEITASAQTLSVNGATFRPGSNDRCIQWNRSTGQPAFLHGNSFQQGGPGAFSVYAQPGADPLAMLGSGGDLSGEAFDFDPGEPGNDVVSWAPAAIQNLAAHPGNQRVLLVWNAGAQTGTGFNFEIHRATQESGPFVLVATTTSWFYVDDQLINNSNYYYYIRIVAWGTQGANSNMVEIAPRAAALTASSPSKARPNGLTPGLVVGSDTHFGASTSFTTTANGVAVPASSIVILSSHLLLYDLETSGATAGVVTMELRTAHPWAEHGVQGFEEALDFQVEISPAPSPAYPSTRFVDTGGAVMADEFTDGAFLVALEFDTNGGAPIIPATLQCELNRDIMVGGQLVTAGTDLGAVGLGLWQSLSAAGGQWPVDQVFTTVNPIEEHISPGELIIRVRVANDFGFYSTWDSLRIFVNGQNAAFVTAYLVQGLSNQVVTIFGSDLPAGADWVNFDDPEIEVHTVVPFQPGYFHSTGSQDPTHYQVTLSVGLHARIGPGLFELINLQNPGTPISTGGYTTTRDATTSNAVPSFPDPLAAKAAVNVTLQNGRFSWTSTDLVAEGRAFPIVWDRTYCSDHATRWTPLGMGWIGTYLQWIDIDWNSSRYESFTWHAPDGGVYRFAYTFVPEVIDPTHTKYTTPVGLAAKAYPTRTVAPEMFPVVQELAIQTSEGVTYHFGIVGHKKVAGTSDTHRWRLTRVEDMYGNRHELTYNEQGQLVRIDSDAISAAVGAKGPQGSVVFGECLALSYHSNGNLKEVRSVRQFSQFLNYDGSTFRGGLPVLAQDLEVTQYWHNHTNQLALHRLPPGSRHGTCYNGYVYEQASGGPPLLTKILSPSQVDGAIEAVPASNPYNPGSSFTLTGTSPSLVVQYQQVTGPFPVQYRVVQQQALESNAGSQAAYRTWQIGYATSFYANGAAEGAVVTRPDGTSEAYTLTQFGQPTQVAVSDGSAPSHITTYHYHDATRATAGVVRPKGDSTWLLYAFGDTVVASGSFAQAYDVGQETMIALTGVSDIQNYIGLVVRLRKGTTEYHRYAVVLGSSAGPLLRIQGSLQAEGWTSGSAVIYAANDSPLARYKVYQRRECAPNQAWSAGDLVTTQVHEVGWVGGKQFVGIGKTIDPYGNVTTVLRPYVHTSREDSLREPPTALSTETLSTITARNYRQWDDTERKVESVVVVDAFGRQQLKRDPVSGKSGGGFREENLETSFQYYNGDLGTASGSNWKLQSTTVTRKGYTGPASSSHAPTELITSFTYDAHGNLASASPPRSAAPAPYSDSQFKTEYTYNVAGQLVHARYPASGHPVTGGTQAGAVRPETWFYYDKDGQLAREVSLLLSSRAIPSSVTPGGTPAMFTDSQVESEFARPSSREGAGWLHTVYERNAAGEVISTTTDIDINGLTAKSTVTYDSMGRVQTETDAEGRTTDYSYEIRGLVKSVTRAKDSPIQATTEYQYDENGNLTKETPPGGIAVTHEYDGFNRRVKTVTPAAGGTLKHTTIFPTPGEEFIVKQRWEPVGGTGAPRETWTYYDELGRRKAERQRAMNAQGQPLAGAVDSMWAETRNLLDPVGNVLETRASYGSAINSSGILLYRSVPNGFGWVNSTLTDGARGAASSAVYDHAGNVIRENFKYVDRPADSATVADTFTQAVYDPANHAWKTIDCFGAETLVTRNNLGWPEATVDATGRATSVEYNFAGQPTKTTVGSGSEAITTEKTYDKTGLVLSETARRGNDPQATTYEYDSLARLAKITRPDSGHITFTFDSAGRLSRETRFAQQQDILHQYDNAGNLITLTVQPSGQGGVPVGQATEVHEFTHNAYGEVLIASTRGANGQLASTLTMAYNTMGQIEFQSLQVYDEQGSPISVNVTGHPYPESVLGFVSRYYGSTRTFSLWSMSATYDVLGRETRTGFWDGRFLHTLFETAGDIPGHQSSRPESIIDSGVEAALPPYPLLNHIEILRFEFEAGLLKQRAQGVTGVTARHNHAPRPSVPGKLAGQRSRAWTRFQQDARGMLKRVDLVNNGPNTGPACAGIEMRRDRAGNPVMERRTHQGGLSRVMQYDFAGRMSRSLRGHLVDSTSMPGDDVDNASSYIASPESLPQQWRRDYGQDSVDNITGYQDFLNNGPNPAQDVSQAILSDKRNLIDSRSDNGPAKFEYDTAGRMTYDATTALSFEYNYRGQAVKVKDASGAALRTMSYDAFGRMVRQVDAPGTFNARGTIFVPNIGFGGDGHGADTAAEVTYQESGYREALEIVQFTYGPGAVAGGIGRKRLVEFVAHVLDRAPYFRFLHEDTLGSTVAATSLWGDRLDEYDYTDYGIPLHAPVALDGRYITDISAHASYPGISQVTLSLSDTLEFHELMGCELRVVRSAPSGAGDVYLTGTVLSHLYGTLLIDDPGHAMATAWQADGLERHLTAVYDLREGFTRGVMDHAQTGSYTQNGWASQPQTATFIRADHGPFDLWMGTTPGQSQSKPLYAKVGPDASGQYQSAMVLGVWQASGQPVAGGRYQWLALKGDVSGFCGPGKRFEIDGRREKHVVAQSGTWTAAASGGAITTFTLHPYAWLSQYMVGWMLQPDVNAQVYLPITEVSQTHHTMTVDGAYAALGAAGTRFRIYAPPGVQRHGEQAGTLGDFVAAASSRCLFAGYRYESPLAGFDEWSWAPPPASPQMTVTSRQGGNNFAGQYYTLHRHYDPNLMRFTSPDPIASPFFNLFHYAGNNPAGAYDPDGLARKKKWSGDTFTKDLIDSGLDVLEGMVTKFYGGGAATVASGFQMAEGAQFGDTFVGRGLSDIHQRRDAWLVNYGEDGVAARLYATGGVVGDMIGITGLREGVSGRDAVTGESLGRHERYERAVDGASSLLLTAGMAAAPRVAPWASRIGSGARVGGTATLPMFRRMTPELAPGPHRAQIQYLKAMRQDAPKAPSAYRRPAGATTKAQRQSVQGQPCWECGSVSRTMIADHRNPLVVEWYETGTIDLAAMRSLDAVRAHCPKCSPGQGGRLRRYSVTMREHLRFFGRK
ncbi:MAG: VCBS repeat-containing protein [Planctomycetes bacterium]|nr:VCBS repeat-containing protein [Planctomycetota bacterium]